MTIRTGTGNVSGMPLRHARTNSMQTEGGTIKAVQEAEAPIAIEGDGGELRMQELGGGIKAQGR